MSELLFEESYEMLQEVAYGYKGNIKKTKNIILKAPTFKHSEKLETALRQLNFVTAIANFICDAGLIVSRDEQEIIPSASLNDLHIKAVRALVDSYCKFFLASEQSVITVKSES